MKRLHILIVFFVAGVSFHSCNNAETEKIGKNQPDSLNTIRLDSTNKTASVTDECDYYVDRAEGERMIQKYMAAFDNNGLTDNFWISKCAIQSIKTFLDNNPTYDGVRFFLGAKLVGLTTRSVLLVTPTTKSNSTSPLEKHTNQIGVDIPLGTCNPGELEMNLSVGEARKQINRFGEKFRDESIQGQRSSASIDPLSIAIWVSRCKIDKMMDVFTQHNTLTGLMAICAAYYKDDARRSGGERKYVVQSTLIFVPTENGRVLNWNAVPPPAGWKSADSFNHGELCPQQCE
jgi:hypothetical protein